MDVKRLWQDKGASILTGLGVVGVFSTAVMAAKDTPKALEILKEKEDYKVEKYGHKLTKTEKALALIPLYLPTILIGTATAGCILGANHINKQNQAALISAYTYLDSSYKEYQRKVKEVFGEEAEKKIREEIQNDIFLHDEYGSVNEKKLMYDEYSNRYFEMTLYELQVAMYNLNRMYNHIGEMSLNEFYEFIDLKPVDIGDKLGWNGHKDWECCGFSWIHLFFEKIETPDGLDVLAIRFNIEPSKDFQEW